MPSPFPGMDPWLEHPEYFGDLHDGFVTHLQEAIQPQLPEPYYAKKGRRVWLEHAVRPVEPDVFVTRRSDQIDPSSTSPRSISTIAETGPVAVLSEPAPIVETKQIHLDIFTGRRNDRRLVTSIEVISPTNKSDSGRGRALYLQKQQELLVAPVHLLEIDLLRGGLHATAVPRHLAIEKTGGFDYHVCLHCFNEPDIFYVYPIHLSDPLPEIAVPLLPEDAAITVDLQNVFNLAYDGGPFRREVLYDEEEPAPPLTEEQQRWAREILQAPK